MDTPAADAERRAFYLSLDPETGQVIAQHGGFVPPSTAVMVREQQEVMKSWMKMSALGVVDQIDEYVDWYLDVMGATLGSSLPKELRSAYQESIRHLMVSTILGLARRGSVSIKHSDKLEFESYQYDPEKGEIVLPDEEMEKAIEELEHVFKNMEHDKDE